MDPAGDCGRSCGPCCRRVRSAAPAVNIHNEAMFGSSSLVLTSGCAWRQSPQRHGISKPSVRRRPYLVSGGAPHSAVLDRPAVKSLVDVAQVADCAHVRQKGENLQVPAPWTGARWFQATSCLLLRQHVQQDVGVAGRCVWNGRRPRSPSATVRAAARG